MTIMFISFKEDGKLAKMLAATHGQTAVLAEQGWYAAGEMKVRIPGKIDTTCYVVANIWECPMFLMRVIFLANGLRLAGAKELILVAPWIAYGRQDKSGHGETPAGLEVARLLCRSFDSILTLDAHSPEFRSAFKRKLVNVMTGSRDLPLNMKGIQVVVAPDMGASSRAEKMAHGIGVPWVALRKVRGKSGVTTSAFASDRKKLLGKRALLIDDMADSGQTLKAAATVCRKNGATAVYAFVTHALDLAKLKKNLVGVDALGCVFDHQTQKLRIDALKDAVAHI